MAWVVLAYLTGLLVAGYIVAYLKKESIANFIMDFTARVFN